MMDIGLLKIINYFLTELNVKMVNIFAALYKKSKRVDKNIKF